MYTDANVTIQVTDFNKMVTFYTEVLGLRLKFRNRSQWAEIAASGVTIGFAPIRGAAGVPGTSMSIGLTVENLREAVKTLEKKGLAFPLGVTEIETAYLATFTDPEGNSIYLCEIKRPV